MLIKISSTEPVDVQFIEDATRKTNTLKNIPEINNCLQDVDEIERKCFASKSQVEIRSDNKPKGIINNVNGIHHLEVIDTEINDHSNAFEKIKEEIGDIKLKNH